ncbi:MAG: fibronectin type III domain-containing protein, partial [Candidatus Omnitrophica bacterium]|nr:fibronectin type III domain-containing protein [Candidatus Omnitrophota bacterium]
MKKHLLNSKRGLAFIISVILLSPFSFTYNTLADGTAGLPGQTALLPQMVYISSPQEGAYLHTEPNNKVNVVGSAYLDAGFKEYQLYYASAANPLEMKKILERPATTMIRDSSLCFWDTAGIKDGEYILILKVKAVRNQQQIELTDSVNFTIDNVSEPPEFVNQHNHGTAAGRMLKFRLNVKDPDDPATVQGRLKLSCPDANKVPRFSFNPQTGIVSWNPSQKDKGRAYKVIFVAKDDTHTVTKELEFAVVDIKEKKINTFSYPEFLVSLFIEGDNLVWNEIGRGAGIYKYDLNTKQKNRILSYHPIDDFSQNKLVWITRNQLGKGNISLYDLSTGLTERIDIAGKAFRAKIGQNRVVWDDGKSLNAVNLSTHKKGRILGANAYSFALDGEKLVFGNFTREINSRGIYLYDFTDQSKKQICRYSSDSPQISGDDIIWIDFRRSLRHSISDLYLYNLAAKKETLVAADIGNASGLDIDQGKITWGNDKVRGEGIYLYDIARDMEVKVASGNYSYPKIFGNRIAWRDKDNIYLGRVAFAPVVHSIEPQTVNPETEMVIKGKDFGSMQENGRVIFENKATCEIVAWKDNEITCKVPAGAVTGLVKVINAAGESNGIRVTVEALVLPPPATNLNATNIMANEAIINWAYDFNRPNSDLLKNFIIRRKDLTRAPNAGYITIDDKVARTALSYTDKTVRGNTEYHYRVYATPDGELYTECRSDALIVKTPVDSAIPAPANLTATVVSSSRITLHWKQGVRDARIRSGLAVSTLSANILGYKIDRRTAKTDFKTIATVNNKTLSFEDAQAKSSTKYFYRVRAYNQTAVSADSNIAEGTTPKGVPAGPTALGASVNSPTQISLTWVDNSEDEDGFKIERRTENNEFVQIGLVAPNVMDYVNTNLTPDSKYYFRVRAFNNLGDSEYSNTISATTSSGIPNAPSGLSAVAASATQIDLNWEDNSHNEVGFMIERRMEGTEFDVVYIVGAGQNRYSDTGLSPLAKFYYRVRAYNIAGESPYSNIADATTPQIVPYAPTALGVYPVSTTEIGLTWVDNANNEEGFKIERSLKPDTEFQQITTLGADISNYNDKDLSSNTAYYYRVRAYNSAGDSGYSNINGTSTYNTAPGAPSGLTASAVSASEVDLNWKDNANNEAGFWVERHLEGEEFAVIAIVNADVVNFQDIGISPNTRFYYRVRAYNAVGESDYSNTVNAKTPQSTPVAPTALGVSISSATQIRITWVDNANNEDGFKVERSLNPDSGFAQIATTFANTNIFDDTNINLDNTYYYRVCAFNDAGNSEYTNVGTAPVNPAIPLAPGGLVATAISSSGINLAWVDNSDNETGFKIERRIEGGNFTEIRILNAGENTYSDTQLSEQTKYYYRVRAFNLIGNSKYSNKVSATTVQAIPYAPTALAAVTASASEINLYWVRNSTNETGFKIERSLTPEGNFNLIATVGAGVETYSNKELIADTAYYYRVFAYNAAGNSPFTNIAVATTAQTSPLAPSNLGASAQSPIQIDLKWTDNSNNETGFKIERAIEENGSASQFVEIKIVNADVNAYSDTQVSPVTKYYYRVRAMNLIGDSQYSNTASATTPQGVPAAPTALAAAAASSTEIRLYWVRNSINEDGYKIERKINPDDEFVQIGTVAKGVETFSNTGLIADTTYYYRVRAHNNAGNSAYTNIASATTITGIPEAPSQLLASAAQLPLMQINLNWQDNSHNETGFKIERKIEGGNFEEIRIVNANVYVYSDTRVAEGTKYHYRVRAFNLVGDSANSNTADAVTPVNLPLAPENLTATAIDSEHINLDWQDSSSNETGFKIERRTQQSDFAEIAVAQANATGFADENLSEGTKYYYRIRATNSAGDSAYSNTADATTPIPVPTVPQNLQATAINTSQIDLNWEHSGVNVTGFRIIRGTDGLNFPDTFVINSALERSYHNTGLGEGTAYYYKICALNSTAESGYSEPANAMTLINPPPAPFNLKAQGVSVSQINLSWDDAVQSDHDGFKLERKLSGGVTFTQIATLGAEVRSYDDSDALIEGESYDYRLRASRGNTFSEYSNNAGAITLLSAPSNLIARTVSSSAIDLSWQNNAPTAEGFHIGRSDTAGGNYEIIATVQGADNITYQETNLSAGTTYHYKVAAHKQWIDSEFSNRAQATTQPGIPAAPTGFSGQAVNPEKIDLLWTDNAVNETGFKLERKKEGEAYNLLETLAANTENHSDVNLSEGTKYYYRLRATNASGDSDSVEVNVTTPINPPAAPKDLAAIAASTTQINLEWVDASDNEAAFQLERSTKQNEGFVQIVSLEQNTTVYEDKKASSGTTYYYRIRAINAAGNSAYSNIASATTFMNPPAAPSGFNAKAVSGHQIDLSWHDNADNESEFKLERRSSDSAYAALKVLPPNTTSYSDANLTAATTYYYRLKASNSGGDSDVVEASAATFAPIPSVPTSFTGSTISTTQVNLAWQHNGVNLTGFKVIRGTNGSTFPDVVTVTNASARSYNNTGLNPGIKYYYKICALNSSVESDYAGPIAARTFAITASATDVALRLVKGPPGEYTYTNAFVITNVCSTGGTTWLLTPNQDGTFTSPGGQPQSVLIQGFGFYEASGGLSAGHTLTVRGYINNNKAAGRYAGSYKLQEYIDNVRIDIATIHFSIVVEEGAPIAPSGLSGAAISSGEIDLSWIDNSNNEDGFEIFTATSNNGPFEHVKTVSANATSFRHLTAFNPGSTYYYNVKAYKGTNYSVASNTIAVVMDPPIPAIPGNLTAAAISSNQVRFTWQDNSNNEDGFKIGEGTKSTGPFYDVETVPANATTFTRTSNFSAGTTYYFVIRAYKGVNFSGYSNVSYVGILAAPSDLTATVISGTQINLTWVNNANNLTKFKLERKTDNTAYSQIAMPEIEPTTYSDTNLTPGTKYYYRIRATNDTGDSGYSNEVSVTMPLPAAAPSNLVASSALVNQINLSWTDNANNENGFKLERSAAQANGFTQIANLGANTTAYEDKDLASGMTYYYRIKAFNESGDSAYSNVLQIHTLSALQVSATAVSEVLQLGSDTTLYTYGTGFIITNNGSLTGFRVSANNDATFTPPGGAAQSVTATDFGFQWSTGGINAGASYTVKTFCWNGRPAGIYAGTGKVFESISGKPEIEVATVRYTLDVRKQLAAPTNLRAELTGTPGEVRLTWDDNADNEAGFIIEEKPSGFTQFIELVNWPQPNKTNYITTGYQPGVACTFRVLAYNAANRSAYSNEASVIFPLVAPTNLNLSAVNSQALKLSWKNNTFVSVPEVRIERRTESSAYAQIESIAVAGETQTYNDSSLSANTKYYYRLRCHNANGDSPYSQEVNATTPADGPAAPSNLSAIADAKIAQVSLSWLDNSADENGFKIERRKGSAAFQSIGTVAANVKTYLDASTDLTELSAYEYRVYAYRGNNDSGYSNIANVSTRLNAPSDLAAQAVSAGKVSLTWKDNSQQEQGVKIIRGSDLSQPFTVIATLGANVTSYNDTTVAPNTKYYYLVFVYKGSDYSEYTNYGIVTTPQALPEAPRDLAVTALPATGSTTQVKLDWQFDRNNADQFMVELSYESASSGFIQIGTADGSARTISWYGAFPDNTTSYYRIRAHNSIGYSGYSNVASVVTRNESYPPSTPTGLAASAVDANRIRLSWANVTLSPATDILIERGLDGRNFTQVASVTAAGATQSADDGSLVPAKTYYYRLRAHNANGDSGYTVIVNATTPNSIQTPADLKAATMNYNSIRLSWKDSNNDEQGFEVWRSNTSGSGFVFVINVPTYNSPVVVKDDEPDLMPLTTYYYKVRAYRNGIYSNFSNEASAKTLDTPFPHAPTNLVATSSASNQVNLSWKDNSANENAFRIYRRTGTSGEFGYLKTVDKNIISTTDTTVSSSTLYYYRVMAINSSGESAYAEASVTTASGIQTPTNLQATAIDYKTIRLVWNDSNNDEQGFEVWRSNTSGSGFVFVINVPPPGYTTNVIVKDDDTLNPLTTYYYKVRAYRNSIYSNFSNQVSGTTPDTPFPHAPTNLAATSSASNQVNLSWKDNSNNENTFKIYRRTGTSGSFSYVGYTEKNITTAKDTGVSSGILYYYRVTAVNNSGESAYAEASVTTPSSIQTPTELTAATMNYNSIRLSWKDSNN